MLKYTIYIDINDQNDLLLPHKAGRMGFDISAIQHGTTRRLVYERSWRNCVSSKELFNLEQIEKKLNVTVKIDKDTEEPIAGIEFDFMSPIKVAKLQQWLLNESQESSSYHPLSKYEWKHFSDIEGLIEKINYNSNITSRFAVSPAEDFNWLTSREKLSKDKEEKLWEVAQRIDQSELWNKAEELAMKNYKHPLASVRRAKEFKINDRRLALAVSILKRAINNQVFVLFKVYSLEKEKKLPARLKLLPLDEQGQPVMDDGELYQITADDKQSQISLPVDCEKEERFIMEMSLDNWKTHEYFVA